MPEDMTSRVTLEKLVIEFTEAFNREDIDEVMSYFADDAIYDEFHGGRHIGKAAIREAFIPQFQGVFGRMRFHTEDMFVDVGQGTGTGKAMIRWLLTVEEENRAGGWRGLDLLYFEEGRLKEKHTYAKTLSPRVDKITDSDRVRCAIEEGVLTDL